MTPVLTPGEPLGRTDAACSCTVPRGSAAVDPSSATIYYQEISVPRGELNEDPNYFDDNDEIYVVATFYDADGRGRAQVSNGITSLF